MHVLVTADTLGGVWTYTRELVGGLARHGIRVTLVSFGEIPTAKQCEWVAALPEVDYRPTGFRLEWMQQSEQDIAESSEYLLDVIRETKPDLLHFSQYCYGSLPVNLPRIVVAHSDVVSWWVSVDEEPPPDSGWLRSYHALVSRGIQKASAVVAPSQWMLEQLCRYYPRPNRPMVVYNGRSPELFNAEMPKDRFVLSVGRLWDSAKQVVLLTERNLPLPVCIAGSGEHPEKMFRGDPKLSARPGLQLLGPQCEEELRGLYGRAALYAATSRYEPFGLGPLEAALSRCALVANDIRTFRELWGDAALYFRRNDADGLVAAIRQLSDNPALCESYGQRAYHRAIERFTADRMVAGYVRLYKSLVPMEVFAA